ncbi:MAG: hypothetical protein AAF662_03125 [Pseudomonadota bacterium]
MFTTLLLVISTLLGALSGHVGVFLVSIGLLLITAFPWLLLFAVAAGLTYYLNHE